MWFKKFTTKHVKKITKNKIVRILFRKSRKNIHGDSASHGAEKKGKKTEKAAAQEKNTKNGKSCW